MQKAKYFILLVLTLMLFSILSQASTPAVTASQVLQSRLQKLTGFYAKFTQKVTSEQGEVLQQGSGEVWAQRPDLFDWKMEQPQQMQLISNGKTVWIYEPDLAQVTCLSLDNYSSNTLFMLILGNNPQIWQQYKIQQQGNLFTLTPLQHQDVKDYQITISAKGKLSSFSMVEQDGQRNSYQFTAQRNHQFSPARFDFKIPSGVTVDDQR